MSAITPFDTHKAVKALQSAGFDDAQAEVVVDTIGEAITGHLATKADISELRVDLKEEIAEVKAELKEDIHQLDNKIDEVKAELKEDIHQLDNKITAIRTELKEEIAALKGDNVLMKWMLGLILASTAIPLIQQFF